MAATMHCTERHSSAEKPSCSKPFLMTPYRSMWYCSEGEQKSQVTWPPLDQCTYFFVVEGEGRQTQVTMVFALAVQVKVLEALLELESVVEVVEDVEVLLIAAVRGDKEWDNQLK